jgi:hypothetical protein
MKSDWFLPCASDICYLQNEHKGKIMQQIQTKNMSAMV